MAKYNWNPDAPSRRLRKQRRSLNMHITLHNDLHDTRYTFRTRWYVPLTREQITACRQRLCPDKTCQCGGHLREHGPNDVLVRVGFDVQGREIVTLEPHKATLRDILT